MNFKKLGLFAAGTLFGTAGIKVVTNVQEGAGDILADAKAINDQRAVAAEAEVVEDASVESEPAAETAE